MNSEQTLAGEQGSGMQTQAAGSRRPEGTFPPYVARTGGSANATERYGKL
jgi:hypothetical protein